METDTFKTTTPLTLVFYCCSTILNMSSHTMRETVLVACTSGVNGMKCRNKTSSSGVCRPRTVYVGKYQYLVSLIQTTQVSDVAWKNKAGFDILTSTVNSLLGSHNVFDLITLVDGEVPMDKYSALQNLEKQIIIVTKSVFDIKNLIASEFLSSLERLPIHHWMRKRIVQRDYLLSL